MKKIVWLAILLFASAILVYRAQATAGAAPSNQAVALNGPTTLIRLDPQIRQRYVAPPAVFVQNRESLEEPATATIIVNFNGQGWTTEAQTAFRFAADIWETQITSAIPIEVDADFSPLPNGVLGGAGPTQIVRDFSNAPQPNTWYPIATANKLADVDLSPASADIGASFSKTFSSWYFGTDAVTPAGQINFVSVVLHELGHGLGFFGSMRVDDGSGSAECQGTAGEGCYGYSGFPVIYDRLTENGPGTPLLDFSINSTELGDQLTSNAVYFDSPSANAANGGSRVPLYAPSIWSQGSSYSHLAESYNNTPHALMTYSISRGETIHNPGLVTLCMFNDMGWTVADACGATPITGLTATNNSPTVLGATTYLTATISGGSNVSYEWAFGDGNGDTGAEVSHQYAATGAYTAMVTATNSVGQASTSTFVQVVDAAISGLAAENDGPTTLGSSTHLTATIGGGSNVTYEWTFGDGNGDTGAEVSHQYAAIGSYTAVVTATNSVGQESTSTLVKVVDTAISGLAAENDGPTTLGSSTYFTATISGGSNVTYEWAFGDGESGIGAEVSHQYAAAGTYTATVTASNSVSLVTTKTVVQVKTGAFSIYFPVILKP
jgi:PKD repeat protein